MPLLNGLVNHGNEKLCWNRLQSGEDMVEITPPSSLVSKKICNNQSQILPTRGLGALYFVCGGVLLVAFL